MFFARFEDAEDQSVTTPQQRLEALKQKIAAKQKQHSKDNSHDNVEVVNGEKGVQNEEVSRKHPKKRRKISGTEEGENVKPKKKKKKKHSNDNIARQECQRKKEESEAVIGNCEQEAKLNSKKHKKKKKVSTDNIEGNGNGGSSENDKPRKKKGKKLETSENFHTEEKVDGDINGNDASKQTKKKKKKKKKKTLVEEAEDLNNIAVHETVVEQNEESAADHENDKTEENAEDTMMEEEAEVKEIEEEWTILGKHKTLQKVGHVKRDLPDWIVNSEIIDAEFDNVCSVEEFGLLDQCIVDVLTTMEIKSLFPVQSQIIPDILSGCQKTTMLTRHFTPPSDLCISAPTGSGKTLVYVLSLVQSLYKLPPLLQAIVVVPTKNLANQVKQVFNNFNKLIKVALLSGKDTFPAEQRAMYTDQGSCLVHVVVTTPGRLVNHLRETELFTLQSLRFLVIDEMDTLLNQTYQDWLPSLYKTVYNPQPYRHPLQPQVRTLRYTPNTQLSISQLSNPGLPLQKLLFSATVTHDPSKLAPLQLYLPKLYSSGGKYNLPSTLVQYQIRCQLEDKALVLIHLVKKLKHVLCFASSVDTSHRLAILTEEFGGIKVAEYSSTLTVQQRNKVMRDFSVGNVQLMVCSDSLARGMDISLVDHVINYDVPAHVQTYVHRVGRTARAGKVGHAYTLLRYEEIRHFHQLLKKAGDTRATEMKIPEDSIAELSEGFEDCLQRLEIRLKAKGKK